MTYIIGEIGQNHNGSVEVAKMLVELLSKPVQDELFELELKGMNAIKMTKRDLNAEMSSSMADRPYLSEHSFGKTYGEHRAYLELTDQDHFEVYKHAKKYGLDFVETICSEGAMSLLRLFEPDHLKVASRDLTNHPLLSALGETNIPIIISTGMAGNQELESAIAILSSYHNKISILHCVSEYPTHPNNVNLKSIEFLNEKYPQYTIGYSDHTIGISVPVAAVAIGAKILEKHVTLHRGLKGSDQKGSLGPDGVSRMVRDVRLLERSLGEKRIFIEPSTQSARLKLERSIASNREIMEGEIVNAEDIHLLSPGDGFKWSEKDNVIGKKTNKKILKNELIYQDDILK